LPTSRFPLTLSALAEAYAEGVATPVSIIDEIYASLATHPRPGVFISLVPHAQARAAAERLEARRASGERMRLFGVPFAVKDNIDAAGFDTTAGCPAFGYRAERDAFVVEPLLREGALLIGKTNLDQFATGLSGTRSPYGTPHNPFDPERVPGGSSSGSAVAVSLGLCAFALGTDTAGSGRVPAAFNNIVGLKPTRGMLSTRGVVPACRSLDCVSVFALEVDDATQIAQVMSGFDPEDPYAADDAASWDPRASALPKTFRFAVPRASDLVLRHGPSEFAAAVRCMEGLGGDAVELDLAPFHATAKLLYDGPVVAERLEANAKLLAEKPDAIQPVVREILMGARRFSAADAQRGQTELRRLRRICHAALRGIDCLIVPSASLFPRVAELLADPIGVNSELGRYTNFVNLLDLCALAVPAGLDASGLPCGVTLIGARGRDAVLAGLGRRLHAALNHSLGATGHGLTPQLTASEALGPAGSGLARLAVVGAHLAGQPLNHELSERGARLIASTHTAPEYRLYALKTTPPKPGLVRVAAGSGAAIELEVWELSQAALGSFIQGVAGPLCIGTVLLANGERVHGFLCEGLDTQGAADITAFGGWRAFRNAAR
jgi:allophanate hydrolase